MTSSLSPADAKLLPMPADTDSLSLASSPARARPNQGSTTLFAVRSSRWTVALIFAYSAFLALGTFALNGRYNLNLADEGFLRYGVRAILHAGQVPVRDFQSYDPGRYYWAAAWSLLLGDGIVTTRFACTIFQIIGVGLGLLALRRAGAGRWLLGSAGLLLTFWMVERFKLYEQCIALAALYPAVRLIQQPHRRNALFAGVFVGLAACMGHNHGFYNAVAFGGLLALLAWKHRSLAMLKLGVPWAGGIVLGYLPMLLALALVPGFCAAFMDDLRTIAHAGATNLTISVPWPWTLSQPAEAPRLYLACEEAVAWCFVLLLVGFGVSAVALLRLPVRRWQEHAAFVAATVVGIPYMHYAFSRADLPHLAHSVPVLLVALLLLPAALEPARHRWTTTAAMAGCLGVLTFLATFIYNPVIAWMITGRHPRHEVMIGEQTLLLNEEMTAFVMSLQHFEQTKMAPDENILIAPCAPSLYEVVGRFSPLKEIYFLWPQPPETEREDIRELERQRVNWVLLSLEEIDKKAERRLPRTHPLLLGYIRDHFTLVRDVWLPPHYVLLHRAAADPGTRP